MTKTSRLVGFLLAALAVAAFSASVDAQTTIRIGYATAPMSHDGLGTSAFCDDVESAHRAATSASYH